MISFVIPAYNEEVLLGRTVASIHRSAEEVGVPHEVIVADDGSTDATAAVAAEAGARVVPVRHRQIAATRNAGARAAAGDRLIFVDADTTIDAAVLRAALEALDRGAVGGGAGVRFDGPVPFYARCGLAAVLFFFRCVRYATGCFVFATRSAFDEAGGFDERYFAGEEIFLSRAMKRVGRFVVLREKVTTSARKVRAYSALRVIGDAVKLVVQGPWGVRSRRGTELWYEDDRRGQ